MTSSIICKTLLLMFKYLVVLFISFTTISAHTQEASGLSLGNYNGLLSTKLNPAFINKSQNKWEVQLIGSHLFFENNYGYVDNTSFTNLIGRTDEVEIYQPETDVPLQDLPLPLIFNEAPRNSFVDLKGEILGPGIMITLRDKYKVGVSYKLRGMAGAQNISSSLNYHNVSNLQVDSVFQLKAFDASAALWSEYAVHLGIQQNKNLSIGATLKYLRSHLSSVFSTNVDFDYRYQGSDLIEGISGSNFQIGYNENNNGWGLALDAGFLLHNFDGNGSEFGFSILDLGWMRNNGSYYNISFQDATQLSVSNYENIDTYEALITQLENDFIDIESSDSYTILAPTAFSLQYKRKITKYISAEAFVVQNLKWSNKQLRRSNSFNVTGLYERKHFSAFLPIALYDFNDLRVGAALRFAFLTIGSDNLISLVGSSQQFRGSDVYVNIKIYPFAKKQDSGKEVECYF